MRLSFIFFLTLSLLQFHVSAQSKPPRRSILPESIREVSGMTLCPNGDLWLLNDSRNPPELFRFDPINGNLLETRRLPLNNRDWEDLTHDPQGRLYIGDFGNNRNGRRNLRIYRYDPVSSKIDSLLFRYPDQQVFPPAAEKDWNFNCEAMVWYRDSLHIFSKNSFKGNFICKQYVLPARLFDQADQSNETVAELRDSIVISDRVVTGAAMSPDGQTLIFTSYIVRKKWGFIPHTKADLISFSNFRGSNFFTGKKQRKKLPKCMIARQFESVTYWKGSAWLVANERRAHQKPAVWKVKHRP